MNDLSSKSLLAQNIHETIARTPVFKLKLDRFKRIEPSTQINHRFCLMKRRIQFTTTQNVLFSMALSTHYPSKSSSIIQEFVGSTTFNELLGPA